tara:strand:+ start:454 stop:1218 length:765 start_codon:yes stop_codon:yes gene_type:complete
MFFINLFESKISVKNFVFHITYYTSTQSTNEDIWELYNNEKKSNILVITDNQLNGKGQFNNTWYSMPNKSITCSFLLNQVFDNKKINFHSLIIPISIVRGIKKMLSINVKLKWPNDIMYDNKKLGGILIESKKSLSNYIFNIGIGLNVNEDINDFPSDLKNKAISLKMIKGDPIQREPLLASIFNALDELISNINYNDIIEEWMNDCMHKNNKIKFKYKNQMISGIFKNINKHGQAIIDHKKMLFFYDGPIQII